VHLALWLAAANAAELSIPHTHYELPNGLDVVLAQDRSNPIVHVQVWYHVGSKDERPGRTGFAHLFEHLMFQGSLSTPGEYFAPIQEVGGDLNGTTNSDRTNYYETLPSQFLPLALFMESDRMGALLEVLDQTKLDNQREVVRNERRQRYETPPYGTAWITLMGTLFPDGHPYHHATIGTHADLEAASLDDVKAFFQTWYTPDNATLVIVGDFDLRTAKKLVKKNFGWIPRGPGVTRAPFTPSELTEDKVVVQHEKAPDGKVWLAWTSPPVFQPGDAELDLVASLLCSGKDSRLYTELVRDRRIARDVDCSQGSRSLQSAFIFEATANDGHTTEEVAAAILDAVKRLTSDTPPTADELDAARVGYEVGFYGGLSTIAGKGSMMSSYLNLGGGPDRAADDLARYTRLTPADLLKVAADTFGKHHIELHILPEAASGQAESAGGAK
jgi:zinc protease